MPDKQRQVQQMRDDVPATIARSDDKAVRTYKETLESAESQYGPGERARRVAMASLKHTHEKVGDHWEPKAEKGPSDAQAAASGPQARERPRPTAEGVDANASKEHLVDVARRLRIDDPERLTRAQLVDTIRKANRRATDQARGR